MSKFTLLASMLLIAGSAAATEIPLDNSGFEIPIVGKRVPGWSRTQHAGVSAYVINTDSKTFAEGKHSISMHRTSEQVYGLIKQRIESEELGGKSVELSAMVKTAEVGKLGWVMMMTFKNYSNILAQVRAAPVSGDTQWKEIVLESVAPPTTNVVEVGFMLMDGGTGWADQVRLRTVEGKKDKSGVNVRSESAGKSASTDKASDPDANVSRWSSASENP